MANSMPSLLALLGLAAFAGYQNRDKIGGAIKDAQSRRDTPGAAQNGLDGILAGVGDLFSGTAGGANLLTGGLGDLMDRFKRAGQSDTVDSWINPGVPIKTLKASEVEAAIGRDNLAELSKRTGLSHEELIERLATAIPETVDRLTPNGQMPTEEQARTRLNLA